MHFHSKSAPLVRLTLVLFALGLATLPERAAAQAIVMSVNGDPITSVDIEQQEKLLRAMRRPASREAAVESMISDRIRGREASRFGINIGDNDIAEAVQTEAKKLKMTPTQLLTNVNSAGVSQVHARNHFKALLGFSVLVRALNKGVEASEIQVRGELAKEKGKSSIIRYDLRQVVFTVNPNAGPEALAASAKQAEALRSRFASCATGIPYAKTLPGVAVREKIVRTSAQLPDGFKDVLDKTPVGHVTPPSRSPNGIEVIALCDKSTSGSDEDLRKSISERLLSEHISAIEEAKYKELRARAVISRSP